MKYSPNPIKWKLFCFLKLCITGYSVKCWCDLDGNDGQGFANRTHVSFGRKLHPSGNVEEPLIQEVVLALGQV